MNLNNSPLDSGPKTRSFCPWILGCFCSQPAQTTSPPTNRYCKCFITDFKATLESLLTLSFILSEVAQQTPRPPRCAARRGCRAGHGHTCHGHRLSGLSTAQRALPSAPGHRVTGTWLWRVLVNKQTQRAEEPLTQGLSVPAPQPRTGGPSRTGTRRAAQTRCAARRRPRNSLGLSLAHCLRPISSGTRPPGPPLRRARPRPMSLFLTGSRRSAAQATAPKAEDGRGAALTGSTTALPPQPAAARRVPGFSQGQAGLVPSHRTGPGRAGPGPAPTPREPSSPASPQPPPACLPASGTTANPGPLQPPPAANTWTVWKSNDQSRRGGREQRQWACTCCPRRGGVGRARAPVRSRRLLRAGPAASWGLCGPTAARGCLARVGVV